MSGFERIKGRAQNMLVFGGITAMTGAAMLGIGASAYAQDSTPTAGFEETSETPTDRRAARQAEYDAFLDALAVNLGVADGETIDAALRTTLKQRIDERLAAGEISADLAAELKAAIDSGDFPMGRFLPGFGRFGDRHLDGHGGRHERGGDHRGPDKGVDDMNDFDDTLVPGAGTPAAESGATA